MSKTTSVIPIALSDSDSAIQEWLQQFPKSKRTFYLSKRIEDVLNGVVGPELTINKKDNTGDIIKFMLYHQREEYELTNRYLNYINNNPHSVKISTALKMAVLGNVIGDKKEWMKESAHFIKKKSKQKTKEVPANGREVTSFLTTNQNQEPKTANSHHSEQQAIRVPEIQPQALKPQENPQHKPEILAYEDLQRTDSKPEPRIAPPEFVKPTDTVVEDRPAEAPVRNPLESTESAKNHLPEESTPSVQMNPMISRLLSRNREQ